MYISRVEVDVNNRQKIKDLNHLGAYHNWVESLFPNELDFANRSRKLWRLDKLNGKQYLLVISNSKPSILEFELYGVKNTAEIKKYDDFLNSLKNNQRYRFKATLNPVMSMSIPGKRGKLVPYVTVEQKMEFLKSRADKYGFELNENEYFVSESAYETLKKPGNKQIKISKVSFEGQLVITDVDMFRNMLIIGMGREKAYGCGMFTVIPTN